MARAQTGDWRWYMGADEDDDEMMDCGTRDQAIVDGNRQYLPGQSFYIVEARMLQSDEIKMARGDIDTALFAETRNGEWITAK